MESSTTFYVYVYNPECGHINIKFELRMSSDGFSLVWNYGDFSWDHNIFIEQWVRNHQPVIEKKIMLALVYDVC